MTTLVLVPTPVGNLGDITERSLRALREAEVVAAEDTRHSGSLLRHFGIDTPLERLDAHTIRERGRGVLERYERVAFVTDAGTPGISDPGTELVRLALEVGAHVEALPGATAFVPALVVSGLPLARFTFEGFLPRKGRAREERLEALARSSATTALYEAPARLAATLADLARVCGPERPASVSRELSKLHEETLRGSLAELAERFRERSPRGEIVVVVGPAPQEDPGPAHAGAAAALAGAGVRGALLRSALVALGVPRNEAYARSLEYPSGP